MKRFICILLSVCLIFALCVPAFANSADAVVKTITQNDGTDVIYAALKEASQKASEAKPYEIRVEKGTYSLYKAFHIFSNTSLIAAEGVVFTLDTDDNMLKVGTIGEDPVSGYGYENISVIGGEWNSKGNTTTMFKFVHAKNVLLQNVKAHNIKDAHFVEVAAVDGFQLLNCDFYDMKVTVEDGREAVQIDVLHKDHIKGYSHLNDEIDYLCKNIVINGCSFTGAKRAIGSHTVVQGKYFENVQITDNVFKNTTEKSILCYNMKNLLVSGNTIEGGDVGIELKTMDQRGDGTYLSATDRQFDSTANPVDLQAEICNNTVYAAKNHAIILNGIILGQSVQNNGDKIPAGNYYVQGVNIHDNTLTAFDNKCAIKVQYGKDVIVHQNTITADSTCETPLYISDGCENVCVTDNNILSTVLNGIRVYNIFSGYPAAVISEISGNTICAVKSGGYGIRLSDGTIGKVNGNTITESANLGIQADKNTVTGYAVNVGSINSNTIGKSRIGIKIMNAAVNEIISNELAPTTTHSIQIESKYPVKKINKNTISSSGGAGIILNASKATEIKSNIITNPKQQGIYCYNGSTCDSVSGNKISGAKTNGIGVNTSVVKSIDNNTISSCKEFGIYLNGNKKTQVNAIKDNKISSCKLGIKILQGPKATLYNNSLSKNKDGNKYVINGTKQYKLGNLSTVKLTAKKSAKTIKLTWGKKSTVSGYTISRSKKASSAYSKIGTASAKATSYTDKKAAAKTTYYYRIQPYYKIPGTNVTQYANQTQSKGVKR